MGGSTLYKSALVEVDLSELDKLKEISGYAFFEFSDLTDFAFPPNLTIIKFKTFYNCSSLAIAKLPASLHTIERGGHVHALPQHLPRGK